ncbi:MAG: tyrosine-protein phosphatase [Bacteriovoracia bacterium]
MKIQLAALSLFAFPIASAPAADSIPELQTEITSLLAQPAIAAKIALENEKLDLQCASLGDQEDAKLIFPLDENNSLRNHAEILPGIRRFEMPTLEALQLAHAQGHCDVAISLNKECLMAQFDTNGDGAFSPSEAEIANQKLLAYGASPEIIRDLLEFYARNGKICLSPRSNPWHQVLPAKEPEEGIDQVFAALEIIIESKRAKKTVCFHCAYGKHRTGLVAALIELARAPNLDSATFATTYRRYLKHAWFSDCASRIQTLEIIPTIVESRPFQNFRARVMSGI